MTALNGPADIRELLATTAELLLADMQQLPANNGDLAAGRLGKADSIAGAATLANDLRRIPLDDPRLIRLASWIRTTDAWIAAVDTLPDDGLVPADADEMLSYLADRFAPAATS